jgi:pyridoxal phosphate enzyme (YggS family)
VAATHDGERRQAELVTALGAVRARIAAACEAAGRDPRSVTLVAVTKTYPASDVAALVGIGVRDVGEARDQEARAKVAEAAAQLGAPPPPPNWHFVGRLQSRKCRSVASYASAVHSLDRVELAGKLADGTAAAGRGPLEVFVQVSLDSDPERGGVPVAGIADVASAAADRPELRLRGVMAVPPLGADPDQAFARLSEISLAVRDQHPGADAISAGMSDDLEAAITHGSTHVRVGSALLGRRSPIFG